MILLYREAASVIQNATDKKGAVKTLVLNCRFKNKKQLQALVCETLKYRSVLEKILESTGIQQHEKVLRDKWLALVTVYEFLLGQGFRKDSPYKQAVERHKAALTAELARMKIQAKAKNNSGLLSDSGASEVTIPRYVRVNTLKVSVKEVIGYFAREDFTQVTTSSARFMETVSSLKPRHFFQDPHIPELLVFAAGTDLHDHTYYKTGLIILQDKASCIPAFALQPPPGSHVVDCCAAPGNKTTHLAAIMQNQGRVIAFDRDMKRFSTMNTLIIRAGASCIRSELKDFLKVDPNAHKDVRYLLVDPSCSGSGIVGRLDDFIESEGGKQEKSRLEKLSNFQAQILKHALAFPNAERVVYSTCSIHEQENESVVRDVLSQVEEDFELEELLPNFQHRGEGSFSEAAKCVRMSAEIDATHGFFVACFVRRKERKPKEGNGVVKGDLCEEVVVEEEEEEEEGEKKKKKGKKRRKNEKNQEIKEEKVQRIEKEEEREEVEKSEEKNAMRGEKEEKRNGKENNDAVKNETPSPGEVKQNGSKKKLKKKKKMIKNETEKPLKTVVQTDANKDGQKKKKKIKKRGSIVNKRKPITGIMKK